MDQKSIESDIKNYKVREGPIFKRSKFLKEWRDRWLVITHNFLYTFTSKKMDEATDIVDLKDVKSYKSYLRKDEEMIPAGFKLRTSDDMFYFCAKSCHEKWSWIVSLERLLDYKCVGATPYNNVDYIKTKGFESQLQFENGGKVQQNIPPPIQVVEEKSANQAKKQVDEEAEKIMRKLKQQQKELEQQKRELSQKQALFKEEQRRKQEQQKRKMAEKQKQVVQPPPPQKEETKVEPPKQGGSMVANLRSMFENKGTQKSNIPQYDMSKYENKKQSPKKKENTLHISRANIIAGLFDQFRQEAADSFGFKFMIDFLVNVAGDERLGYSQFVIREGKVHENRKVFSEIFVQLLMVKQNYQDCQNLMKFIETCIFQIPGLFSSEEITLIQKKLKDFFNHVDDEAKLQLIIKNMFIMHKMSRYNRPDIFNKLDKLVKDVKKEETRNWAKKLRDDL